MLSKPRTIDIESMPPLGSAMSVTYFNEKKAFMISGGKPSKHEIEDLISEVLPALRRGECNLLISWQGQWRCDIFEVTPETADEFEMHVREEASYYWRTPLSV